MRELQDQVAEWHRATFPEDGIIDRLKQKLSEEYCEFRQTSCSEPEEAADVVIVLLALADRRGWDLEQAVKSKLEIVKRRDQFARDRARGYE